MALPADLEIPRRWPRPTAEDLARVITRAAAGVYAWLAGDEAEEWSEDQKLASLDPSFRTLLDRVFADLRGKGWKPRVVYGWRRLTTQARLVALGRSRVEFSFHNAVRAAGAAWHPSALAADVVDSRHGYASTDAAMRFFVDLRAAAKAGGLYSGGEPAHGFRLGGGLLAQYGLGWDPSHVQARPNASRAAVRVESEAVLRGAEGARAAAGVDLAGGAAARGGVDAALLAAVIG